MQGGDLDNAPIPRIYIVFEGTIVKRPEKVTLISRVLSRRHVFVVDDAVRVRLWDAWSRMGARFDALTFDHDAEDVQAFLDQENMPINTVWRFESREAFIQGLSMMPWVHSVIDHERPLAYGGRGGNLDTVRR